MGAALGVLGAFWRWRPRTAGARFLTGAAGGVAGLVGGSFAMAIVFLGAVFLSWVAPMDDVEMLVFGVVILVILGFPFGFGITSGAGRKKRGSRPFWWPGPDRE